MSHPRLTPVLRRSLLLGATVLTATALAACSGSSAPARSGASSDTAGNTQPSSVTSSPATSSTPSGSSSSTPGGAPGTPSSSGVTTTALCKENQLRASLDPRPVKGSSTKKDLAVIVDFENTSTTACVIRGYPGAALENSTNKQVKQATRTIRGQLLGLPVGQNTLPTVTLQPGGYASAGIEGVNQQEQGAAQAGCDDAFYPRILVTPPSTATPVPFTYKWPVCFSFTVHPANIEKNPPK